MPEEFHLCPVCSSKHIEIFLELPQVPVHCNLLYKARDEAVNAPRADICLGFCRVCSHIYNFAFNPDRLDYTLTYENTLHFSPRFQDYARSLATRLVERYSLYNKQIIEIGCGSGEFLSLLCQAGGNRGTGFDPSSLPDHRPDFDSGRITIVTDSYSEKYANYQADLICCRHVLEHVCDPVDFLTVVRRAIGNRQTVIYFEVPNTHFMLHNLAVWDIIYEHCSYFSRNSMTGLFGSFGFEVLEVTEGFGGQFLGVEAVPSASLAERSRNGVRILADQVSDFAGQYHEKVEKHRKKINDIITAGKRIVLWGAGSKGKTFLNVLKIRDEIAYVIDINPRKQGMFVAGTGQQIVSPEFLVSYQPDTIILMNAIYKNEIEDLLKLSKVTAQILCA